MINSLSKLSSASESFPHNRVLPAGRSSQPALITCCRLLSGIAASGAVAPYERSGKKHSELSSPLAKPSSQSSP